MSAFRDKSNFNLTAAETLQKQSLFDPSIHCAYYACVQELLHIIYTRLKITKEQFERDRRNNKDGTHGWASKLIQIELAKKNTRAFRDFQKEFAELKDLREQADYSEIIAGMTQSQRALRLAQSIKHTLITSFK